MLDSCHAVFHDPSANEVPVVYNIQQFEMKEFSRGNFFVQTLHYCSDDCCPEQPIGMITGQYMYAGCKIDTLDLTHWDMSEVKSLSYMFCRSRIIDLRVNNWQLC